MTRPLPPPGDPLHPDFSHAIHRLVRQARREDLRAEEELRKRGERSRIYKFIRVGVVLIVLQAALLGYLYVRQNDVVKDPARVAQAPPKTCNAAINRAYWKVVAYLADHGRPPPKLEDLVGSYVERLPIDPVTGKPLVYSTDGERFTIRCADSAP
ncbi:MAG TPA: hypothetical protein VLF14_05425 [Candidatus Binatia bacterium]|nr:hypothetical protein [Candidatus Binatia bacterium]